jgi:branched-chain amino acid transport system ATP-binding protein
MAEPILNIVRLSKSFGALRATDQLNLSIEPGEVHAVIGPNGAGKTTLIAQISGELRPNDGEIFFCGENITRFTIQERVRRGLSRSFQITSIFPEFTALQNVAMAVQSTQGHSFRFSNAPERDGSLIGPSQEFLAQVDMSHRAAIPAAELAHGEQRQLEIAMALALQPKLMLLDEPMAGMAREDARRMLSLLRSLKSRVTVLLVEHDMDVVFSLSDRITVMVYGRAIATGSPAEIQAHPAVRKAYLVGT